jgi:hypothetical protein
MALVNHPLFAIVLFVTLVIVVVTALTVALAFVDCCGCEPFVVYPRPSLLDEDNAPPPPPRLCLSSFVISILPWRLSPSLVLCGASTMTSSFLITGVLAFTVR